VVPEAAAASPQAIVPAPAIPNVSVTPAPMIPVLVDTNFTEL
jgi:hypothetical protein